MKRFYIFIFLLVAAIWLQAQNIPSGYYNNAANKTGDELKSALHDIIDNHTTITYAQVWNAFQSTDLKSNGKIWDMYSDIPNGTPPYEYTYGQNQCGEYDSEGDCYNREHSWPKSWFTGDENSVPGRDLHHIFPTDGYVNQLRGNNPFGEVQTASQTFQNGSKLGTCKSSLGYSGTVFEPIDEYKGDFARAYFYMSVRYYGEDSNWGSSGMTNKSEILPWAMTMLLRWNKEDPVSPKEINRNNAVYNIQGNRNPFVDNPEYADMIWDPNYQDVFEGTFAQYTADIVEGDYIIIYNGHALTNTISSNKLTSTNVTPQDGTITNPSRSIVWHIANISNTSYWTIKNEAVNKYAAGTTTKNNMALISDITDMAKWTPSRSNNVFEFENYGRSQQSQDSGNKWLRCNTDNNNAWAPYTTQTGGSLTLYKYTPLEYAYSINGVLYEATQVAPGTSITLESGEDLNDDYTFAGWTDDLSDIENNIHAVGESYQINNNVVLYAIYAHTVSGTPVTTYNKVTTTPSDWSGEYLIVCENNSVVFDGALTSLDAGNNVITNVSIKNGVINSTNALNAATFTIAKVTNTNFYSIKNQNNKYIGWSSSSNNGLTAGNSVLSNAISLQSNGNQILIQGTNNNETITKYLRFNSASGDNNYRFRYYNSNTSNTQDIQLYKKTTTTPTVTTYYIQVRELPAGNTELASITIADMITVPNGAVLSITGNSSGDVDNLVIENGGQVIVANGVTGVKATVRKSVTGWTGSKGDADGWYAISSPVNNASIASFVKGGANGHNVYRYVEKSNYWNEYRGEVNATLGTIQFENLTNGIGYLYRSIESGLEFKGDVNAGNANGEVPCSLSYENSNANLLGFNFLGNPFTHEITMDNLVFNNVYTDGFYLLGEEDGEYKGKWIVSTSTTRIAPMQAFLVQAKAENPTVTIKNSATPSRVGKNAGNNIMLAVSDGQHSDETYIYLKEGHGLNKVEHRNPEIPLLYVVKNGENFAIADMECNTKIVNLGFKAKTIGQYTLSLKTDGDFSYLHLIDRMTGDDMDMLVENSYTFIGTPKDKSDRFVMKLKYQGGDDSEEDVFAYQNGNDIIVDGTGELQVFDMMGRVVSTQSVNGAGTLNASSMPTGVYILRLMGDDIKTQKIVVK
ncbi:MAG: endonuclease [Bacteroidales bacterium]|nr:endonuclease [Bacteroidales bacterium]